jgi:hypothetical protein
MPTYIKTGYWDKKAKAPKEWLDLDLLIQTLSPSPSLQQVTNIGNTTTNNIRFDSSGSVYNRISFFRNNDELASFGVTTAGYDFASIFASNNSNFKRIGLLGAINPYLEFRDGPSAIQISAPSTISNTSLTLPTTSGTLAVVNTSAFTGTRVIGGETYTWQNGILISIV